MPEIQPAFSAQQLIHRDDVVKNVSFNPDIKIKFDLQTAIDDNIQILNKVPLPKHIDKSDIEKQVKAMAETDFNNNPLAKQVVKLVKYANNFHTYFNLYFENIFNFDKELINNFQQTMLNYSNIFMESDLSPFFLRELNFSIITDIKTIETLDKKMHQERVHFFGARNNDIKFRRLCDSHNQWIKPIVDGLEDMRTNRVALLWYIDFQNSSNSEQMFKFKAVKNEKLDKEAFNLLIKNLQQSTSGLRKIILKCDRETFISPVPSDDLTFKLFSNIMPILIAG